MIENAILFVCIFVWVFCAVKVYRQGMDATYIKGRLDEFNFNVKVHLKETELLKEVLHEKDPEVQKQLIEKSVKELDLLYKSEQEQVTKRMRKAWWQL